jgi:hypothetical protein
MGDLTIIILAAMLIMLCVVIIKINDKVDRHIKRFKKLEKALFKNATGQIPISDVAPSTSGKIDIPMAATSMAARSSRQMIAKSKSE